MEEQSIRHNRRINGYESLVSNIMAWAKKDDSILKRLPGCFADYDKNSITMALDHQTALYHDLASTVATSQGIAYPYDQVKAIKDWIHAIGEKV